MPNAIRIYRQTSYNITRHKIDDLFSAAAHKSLEEGYPKIWIMALKGIWRQIRLYPRCTMEERRGGEHRLCCVRTKIRVLLHFW